MGALALLAINPGLVFQRIDGDASGAGALGKQQKVMPRSKFLNGRMNHPISAIIWNITSQPGTGTQQGMVE